MKDKEYYIEFSEVDKENLDVPVKLKNNKFNDAFENIVKTYSMPKYNEIDPTPVVAPFYFMFFGMMVADVGYGLVMSILSYIVLKTCNLNKNMKKLVNFIYYVGFSTIFWGLLYGSYFNLPLGIPSLLDPVTDYQKIMIISILFGIIHIFLGLGMKAYVLIRDGKKIDALLDIGLLYVVISSLILFIIYNNNIVKYIMLLSMLMLFIVSGRKMKTIGSKFGVGLYSIYGLTGYLGDLISYVRLMALGLSGGFIAQSVNMICTIIGIKPLTIIFVIIIFVIGQTVNLLLSMLGAYVHSARLIYVEFFGKFYEGGGKEFKDFVIDEKYINIKYNEEEL